MLIEREKEICDRLRRFREILQIPRTRFSLSIGVSSERLYSYEAGRAQIRYDTFSAVQKQYGLNPVWFATGEESPRLDGFSDEKFRAHIKPRELFSSVYDRLLEKYLAMDRMNVDGRDYLLRVASDYSDPKTLARLKKAREIAGVSLAMLAETLSVAFKKKITERDLAAMETGKQIPNMRMMIAWRYEARINEKWVKSGVGEMFTIPNWKTAHYLERIKQARFEAQLSEEGLAERLAKVSTARVTGGQMQKIEDGKTILMQSVEIGLPHALGVPAEQLFPNGISATLDKKTSLKQNLEKARDAMKALSTQFAELEKQIDDLVQPAG
jgi:transcriptional regulator with XRE-family HTH domain